MAPKNGAYTVPHTAPGHHMPQLPGSSTPLLRRTGHIMDEEFGD